MSKIGRKSINIAGVEVSVKNNEVHYKGPNNTGIHLLPDSLTANVADNVLTIVGINSGKNRKDVNRLWGLHRALLANKIVGALKGFEKKIVIVGLGYKALKVGSDLVFSLGYSHDIKFPLPKEVTVDIDKTGQNLTFKSFDKEVVGLVASKVRALRVPEPYKGTGIKYKDEVIIRKAGKTAKA